MMRLCSMITRLAACLPAHPAAKHCPAGVPLDRAARRKSSPALLWVDDIVPEPDRDSGSIRTSWILRVLVEEGYDVTFQPSVTREPRYTQQLRWAARRAAWASAAGVRWGGAGTRWWWRSQLTRPTAAAAPQVPRRGRAAGGQPRHLAAERPRGRLRV
jgi:hypothetical protein